MITRAFLMLTFYNQWVPFVKVTEYIWEKQAGPATGFLKGWLEKIHNLPNASDLINGRAEMGL